ncbi:NAD-dependent epimerase/dehydratase family protein [Glacieibacterium sp.]|uniref:NAD-dependent epimerase/dehydratase family protein n=1 Tax=Glacieibacterium sp. TaxID=2860237 RepID=UPI003B001F85
MTICITGAAGFIGAATALALLDRGETVIGFDNLNAYYPVQLKRDRLARLAGPRFTFVEGDLADMAALTALPETDAIIHLGAQAGVRYSLQQPHDYVQSNLVGHLNMLELARARQTPHLVYASSSSVYGGNSKLPFAVGDAVDHPVSLYAATKRADELMSDSYAHLFGIPQTGLRFFTVYGPWGRPDMAPWIFTDAVLRGRPIRLNNGGRMKRDFTYVDDIVAGVLAALDRPPSGPRPHRIYNLGNDRSEELTRFLSIIEASTGKRAIVEEAPLPPGDVLETHADITSTRADLGYAPATSLDVGLPRFVDWYRGYAGL